jgi:hypothetical protein
MEACLVTESVAVAAVMAKGEVIPAAEVAMGAILQVADSEAITLDLPVVKIFHLAEV